MINSTNDPDLNLQSFNDHGIFTLEDPVHSEGFNPLIFEATLIYIRQ